MALCVSCHIYHVCWAMKNWWWVSVHFKASFLIFKVLPCQRPRCLKQLQQQLLAISFNASRVQRETGKWCSDLCTANNLIYNQRCSHWQWIAEAATAIHCNYCVHMTLFAVPYFMADGENLLFLFWAVHILRSFFITHTFASWGGGQQDQGFLYCCLIMISCPQSSHLILAMDESHPFNSRCFTSDYPWFCQLPFDAQC